MSTGHDILAIGGSAGSIEVLLGLVGELPADLPASIFVVVHQSPGHLSLLPELLTNRGRLPAFHPTHGQRIERGRVYVAPPDNHLLVRPGSVEVVRGPRENGQRPAADALFRSAAAAYGPRVIGVVLSGYQDCGTAGMMSIKARGGLAVVQTPESALAREMPSSVLDRVEVDRVVHPLELPGVLARLVHAPPAEPRTPDELIRRLDGEAPGDRADLVCPICQGVLTEVHAGVFQHFRCHVGHSFTLQSLVREQGEELERALWAAARALEESASLSHRLSGRENGELRRRFAEQATTQGQQAELIRQILLHGGTLSAKDAPPE